ncbi:MAG: trehalose-phosphatase [Aminobacteriaceae bacterium]
MDLTDLRSLEEVTEQFFRSVKEGSPLLVSDYDGTLAPFKRERDEAVPPLKVKRALEAILEAEGDLVILSGRRADEVARLLALPVEIWGCHGWERRRADGATESPPLPGQASRLLDSMAMELSSFPAGTVELKPVSVALHWRGRERVKEAYDGMSAHLALVAGWAGLEVLPFNGGVEYRLPGCTKGRAIERILEERSGGDAVCYIGDDVTDEDAFRVLRGRGLGILVADRPKETAAAARIKPECVEMFLALWRGALKKQRRTGVENDESKRTFIDSIQPSSSDSVNRGGKTRGAAGVGRVGQRAQPGA